MDRSAHRAPPWHDRTAANVSNPHIRPEGLADQQTTEAGAVDEKVRVNILTAFEGDRGDIAILVLLYVDDFSFRPLHPVLLGKSAQIFRVKRRVEVESVRDMADRQIPMSARACMNLLLSAAAQLIEKSAKSRPRPRWLARSQ